MAWSADVEVGPAPLRVVAELDGPGPWTVRLVATRAPLLLDYRLDQ